VRTVDRGARGFVIAAGILLLFACRDPLPVDSDGRPIFRIGYMPNLTHAPALYGVESGMFEEALGPDAVVRYRAFPAGPSVVEAVLAGELDVAFLGPNPAINAYFISQGEAVRVVSGSTAGGAQLVVRPDVKAPRDFLGQRIATPSLANTQDITARVWLRDEGIEEGKGEDAVEILPIPPSEVLRLFERREVAGAWLPEPWSSRMVIETGGRVLVDEASLWPDGRFPTTVVMASVASLRSRRELLERFLRAHERSIAALRASPEARDLVRRRIEKDLGLVLPKPVVDRAYSKLEFSTDLLPGVMVEFARRAEAVGYLRMNLPIEPMFAPDLVP